MKAFIYTFLMVLLTFPAIAAGSAQWQKEWPDTNFSKYDVDFDEIMSGGPGKDGIPAIDNPRFKPVSKIDNLGPRDPVIVVEYQGMTKAYPLQVLMWHEIANDRIGDMPIAVTYCPLCNASIVFDRRLDGKVLDFGVSGKLRHSDMIMYDRQTESWWQQFLGYGIVGAMTGKELTIVPSSVVPFSRLKDEHPDAKVLVPRDERIRQYGMNPYKRYDGSNWPMLFKGDYDGPVPALAYVVAIGKQAWPLSTLREKGEILRGNTRIKWQKGMASALDENDISKGRDIGFVSVTNTETGKKIVHDVTFAFAFKAFHPEGMIHAQP